MHNGELDSDTVEMFTKVTFPGSRWRPGELDSDIVEIFTRAPTEPVRSHFGSRLVSVMKPSRGLPAALGATIFIILTFIMSADDVAEGDDDEADEEEGGQLFTGTPAEMAEAMKDIATEAEFVEYDIFDEVSDDEDTTTK